MMIAFNDEVRSTRSQGGHHVEFGQLQIGTAYRGDLLKGRRIHK